MDPLVASALIGGVTSLIGGISSGFSSAASSKAYLQATRETNDVNREIVRETNQANLDLYNKQFQDSMRAWNLQNQYNKPSSEVQRLREAGLNPAMSFGDAASAAQIGLPSAAPASGYQAQIAPYEAYSDTFVKGVLDALPSVSQSLIGLSQFSRENIDNQTRDAMNKRALDEASQRISESLSRENLSDKQRDYYNALKEGIITQNRLSEAKYEDSIELSRLETKFRELQNRVIDEANSRDAERLAIERANSVSQRALNSSQISQIRTLCNIAAAQDWRNAQQHVKDMNLKALDENLKKLNVSDQTSQVAFNEAMRNTELYHEGLKDASLVNRMAERAFGLGFRDVGRALQSLFAK